MSHPEAIRITIRKCTEYEPDTVSARILGGYGIGSERTKSDNKLALLEEVGQ